MYMRSLLAPELRIAFDRYFTTCTELASLSRLLANPALEVRDEVDRLYRKHKLASRRKLVALANQIRLEAS